MGVQQTSIFEFIYDEFRITNRIRLIELFGGIGSQAKALEKLGANFEHWKYCDWAIPSIHAYAAIHKNSLSAKENDFFATYYDRVVKEELIKGVSANYNEPLSEKAIKSKSDEWIDSLLRSNVLTNNLINIMEVHASDLDIVDRDKYTYVLCYSFPCQDLSGAGLRRGMSVSQKDGGTRSGLLWEVERILGECQESNCLPQVLIMENVPEVIGKNNIKDFQKWRARLEELGYSNYCEVLNSKDYCIPQNRKRCFMVSLLGEYSYTFPRRRKLKIQLADLLEEEVDKKYILSKKMVDCLTGTNYKNEKFPRGERFESSLKNTNEKGIATCITTKAGTRASDNFIYVKNATKQGYLEAEEGDGVDISTRMQHHRGTVQKGTSQTITTMGGENVGVVVDASIKKVGNYGNGHHAKDVFDPEGVAPTITTGNHGLGTAIIDKKERISSDEKDAKQKYVGIYDYAKSKAWCPTEEDRTRLGSKTSNTILASGNQAGVMMEENIFTETEKDLITEDGNIRRYIGSDKVDEFKEGQMATTTFPNGYGHGPRTHNESVTLNTIDRPIVKKNLIIRKLTPLECLKLMGFEECDYKALREISQVDSQIFHEAGDSIVVTVLMSIFGQLLGIDYESIVDAYVDSLKTTTCLK